MSLVKYVAPYPHTRETCYMPEKQYPVVFRIAETPKDNRINKRQILYKPETHYIYGPVQQGQNSRSPRALSIERNDVPTPVTFQQRPYVLGYQPTYQQYQPNLYQRPAYIQYAALNGHPVENHSPNQIFHNVHESISAEEDDESDFERSFYFKIDDVPTPVNVNQQPEVYVPSDSEVAHVADFGEYPQHEILRAEDAPAIPDAMSKERSEITVESKDLNNDEIGEKFFQQSGTQPKEVIFEKIRSVEEERKEDEAILKAIEQSKKARELEFQKAKLVEIKNSEKIKEKFQATPLEEIKQESNENPDLKGKFVQEIQEEKPDTDEAQEVPKETVGEQSTIGTMLL